MWTGELQFGEKIIGLGDVREILMRMENLFKKFLFNKRFSKVGTYTTEYLSYLTHLFTRAANTDGFEYLCTILRVEGISSGHWDAFVESEETLFDFSKLLRMASTMRKEKRAFRVALFLYSHSTEMSAPYEIFANLLRCCQGKRYVMYPFSHLVKSPKKKKIFAKRDLPYPIQKINHIKELAAVCNEDKLGQIFGSFFRNDVRNTFFHSDYTISEDEFRIIQGAGIGRRVIPLEELGDIMSRCFAFYSAFFIMYNKARKDLARGKQFHRWPNYEVLELLSEGEELTGVKIHFPNNTYAMFERKKYEGTMALNLMCREEGVQLNIGDIQKYNEADNWFVGGKPFDEYGTRYNISGYWKPIIFKRDSSKIQRKVQSISGDREIQGCLFYIYTTGHKAVEFVIKSDTELFRGEDYSRPILKRRKQLFIKKCLNEGNSYIYDGTIYLNSADPGAIQSAIKRISSYVDSFRKSGVDIKHRLKYQMYTDLSSLGKPKEDDGVFSVTLSMDDPRVTLVSTHLGLFPKTDWKIKEEWI